MTGPPRPPALAIFGGLAVAWNQRYLHAARARDLAVLLLDNPGPTAATLVRAWRDGDPSLSAVAEICLAPAGDLASIADEAAAWSTRYAIRGVCSIKEDYVEPAAVVADMIGLPSPGLRAARVCRNKYLQRRYLAPWSPASTLVSTGQREELARSWAWFPAVVKPVGRLASSGVRLVRDPAALHACLAEYGEAETLLVEERVFAPEYSVESLSHDATVCYAGVTEKKTTEQDSEFFVEMGHTTPSPGLSARDQQRLLTSHAEILRRLDFRTGIAHAEYRVTPTDAVRLMEIAVRPPGDSIMALHWLACGAELEDAVVGLAIGESVSYPRPTRFARQVYLPHHAGVLEGLDVNPGLEMGPMWFSAAEVRAQVTQCAADASDPPAVRCVVGLKPIGSMLQPLRESSDRAAMFVLDAPTTAELDNLEARCRAGISLRVRP